MGGLRKTFYSLCTSAFGRELRIALAADLHSDDPSALAALLREVAPDIILLAGDMLEPLDGSFDSENAAAMSVFRLCAELAPTFYCTGNHEDGGIHSQSKKWRGEHGRKRRYTDENLAAIKDSGVHLLINSYELYDGIAIGGLASGLICEGNRPDLEFLSEFASLDAPKLLISHHPEYYKPYIKPLPIDLTVSGHAHGGQWRFFGRGVYAPGQGLFPKYTAGIYEERLVVSRGLKKSKRIPRIFNPTELVIIDIKMPSGNKENR